MDCKKVMQKLSYAQIQLASTHRLMPICLMYVKTAYS